MRKVSNPRSSTRYKILGPGQATGWLPSDASPAEIEKALEKITHQAFEDARNALEDLSRVVEIRRAQEQS
jgi:hypothetical protein